MPRITGNHYLRCARAFVAIAVFGLYLLRASGEETAAVLPLLAAPINATWAANHAEEWRDKGFRGFLFEGLLDDLRLFPTERERLQASGELFAEENTSVITSGPAAVFSDRGGWIVPGHWNDLIKEITGANNRLRDAGIDRNFLHLHLAPDAAWFEDPRLLEIAEQRFRLAGEMCRETKLRGIALNTQSGSFMYDYRWDGYRRNLPTDALSEGAYTFGVRVLRAFIRAFPEGEIILIAQDTESCGPLWFDLIEGCFEAPGAAEDITVRLAVLEPPDIGNRTFFNSYPTLVNKRLKARRSRSATVARQRKAGLVFSLEPIHYEGNMPAARHPLKTYRPALYAAAVYGDAYVLIWAPEGGWWQIPPDLAAQYQQLKQGGAARVRFAPPVPRTLNAYAPLIYGALGARIGSLEMQGKEVDVLQSDRGAALLFWEDMVAPMRLPARAGMVSALSLMAEERQYFTPKEGVVTVPPLTGPSLVEGMSLNDYTLPASIRLDTESPITAGITQTSIEVGIGNPLKAPLRGTLTLVTDAPYGLGAAAFPVNLAPKQSTSFRRMLRGISKLGTRPAFRVNLAAASGDPIARTFTFAVAPQQRLLFFCDGMATAPQPIWPGPVLDAPPLLLCCDVRGRLTCYDTGAQHLLWNRRRSGGYTRPPMILKTSRGELRAGLMSLQGRLSLFNLQGDEKLVLRSTSTQTTATAALPTLKPNTGDLLVSADNTGISLYTINGELVRRIETPGPVRHLLTAPDQPDLFFATISPEDIPADAEKKTEHTDQGTHRLLAYHSEGRKNWEASFSGGISCSPVIVTGLSDGEAVMVIGDFDGSITCLNTRDGTIVDRYIEEQGVGPVLQMVGAHDSIGGLIWIFYLSKNTLKARTLAGVNAETTSGSWQIEVSQGTALAVLPRGEGVAVGTADGDVYALNASGKLLWEDHNALGAVTGLVFVSPPNNPKIYTCIVSDTGHAVRSLDIRRDLLSETPLHLNRLAPPS